MAFKLLLIAGHGRNVDGGYDPGAIGCGLSEADLARELVGILYAECRSKGIDCDIAPDRNYYSWFKNGRTFDFRQYTYVLEVHFNASSKTDYNGNGSLTGTMFYISQDEKGHSVEDAILRRIINEVGGKQAWDGVVVTQRQYTNGLMVQNHVRAQGVSHAVLETCFMSDLDDMKWYRNNNVKIAREIVAGIIEGFGLGKKDRPEDRPEYLEYMVRVKISDLNIRKGPSIEYESVGHIAPGAYTIVDCRRGKVSYDGKESGWGKLKSGAGWICLDFTEKV